MTVERSLTRFISTMATAAWDLMPRWGRWLSAIVLVLWLGWTFLLQERHGGVAIVVMSVMDRPISYVYVNGKMGSNTFAFDGFGAGGAVVRAPIESTAIR
ncbi:hypothetical protein ACW5XA_15940 [Aeromonas dhakensis]|uniref:hypothetical protein n=1 Tax=Aeromonas dhakensis TaxID=196024 RepID=UPI001E2E4295|nr:hypothetical protein [Aeromonas dhakensis]